MGIFEKKTWLNRVSEYPNRRTITTTGGSNSVVTVARNEGVVSQEGDAFNATNMNGLEERIATAFSNALGECEVYEENGGFYIKKDGIEPKKLGSSEGSATPEQVLSGATFNSKNTPDSAEYSTGTMVNNSGKLINAVSSTNNENTVTITIPTAGYYSTTSRVSASLSNVYATETGTFSYGTRRTTQSVNLGYQPSAVMAYDGYANLGLVGDIGTSRSSNLYSITITSTGFTWNCESGNTTVKYQVFK